MVNLVGQNLKPQILNLHPQILDMLCWHEVLRRAEVPAKDIYFDATGDTLCAVAVLYSCGKGKERYALAFPIGPRKLSAEQIMREWKKAAIAFNAGEIGDDAFHQAFVASDAYKRGAAVILTIGQARDTGLIESVESVKMIRL